MTDLSNPKNNESRRSILIVEDNDLNREMLKEILIEDYNVIEAVDGLDGLEKLRAYANVLSIVLLDMQMPRLDGFGFIEATRNEAALAAVPIIVVTGSTITEDEEKSLALGASDFVTKPYNPRVILRRIEAIIRLHESISTLRAVEFDSVTGLYNRQAFLHHAKRFFEREAETPATMLLLNLEKFSLINERYGEAKGNELLAHIGAALRESIGEDVIPCRFNADRFFLLFSADSRNNEEFIESLDCAIHNDLPIRDVTVKYGIYENIDKSLPIGVICDRLFSAIDTIAHQFDRNVVRYDESMSQKAMRMHLIEDCMEQALEEHQFRVFYQPKNDPATGKICGAEALVRWIHPEYGFMSPGDFIPLFENNGFISRLDLYVWNQVCMDLNRWKKQGLPLIPISVNTSRRDYLRDDYIDAMEGPQRKHAVEKHLLHLEITESHFTADRMILDRVRDLHDRGFVIELDDFGSGYSSLGSIKDIPMDVIKMDMSFARELEKKKEIVSMIITLAHSLHLKVVAEGVETDEQRSLLETMGCDYIQGYYYSKPLPADQFEAYIVSNLRSAE